MKCICKEKGTIQDKPCKDCDHDEAPFYDHEGNAISGLVFALLLAFFAWIGVIILRYLVLHFNVVDI